MKYTKPQITNVEIASSAIMIGGAKNDPAVVDGNPQGGTNPGYSADE